MKTVFIFLADGFEEIEAIAPIDILRRAGLNVVTISASEAKIVKGGHDIIVQTDAIYSEVDYSSADMLVIPGGAGVNTIDSHNSIKEKITEFSEKGKPIAAICAAPMILGKLGLLKNKEATCYPGYEKYLYGAKIVSTRVVIDGNIITSKGPGTAMEFAYSILEYFGMVDIANQLRKGMIVSE